MMKVGEGSVKTVLVVDDDPGLLRSAKRCLGGTRRVVTASSGRDALELASHVSVDLVIVDLFLGGQESGIEVLKSLKGSWPSMTIVMMSGLFTTPFSEAARRAGAAHCFEKGGSWESILRLVELDEAPPLTAPLPSLERIKRDYYAQILMQHRGNVTRAARSLRLDRSTLQRNLKKG
jgi:ActR/RegA family two-component response regulator